VLSHVELRVVEPQPVFAPAGAEPEMAMAEEARTTGTTVRLFEPPPRVARRPNPGNGADRSGPPVAGPRPPWAGTPRNAPCPCGSGKKFKHCHGRV
jgi:preprotein translocase subunit SecA